MWSEVQWSVAALAQWLWLAQWQWLGPSWLVLW
jgi:hypothetical protein